MLTGAREDVYRALFRNGPSTCIELSSIMGWAVTSVRPRMTELRKMFHAVATGQRRNKEHEFRACGEREASELHLRARSAG